MNALTSRSMSPLIAPDSGPTNCSNRGRSVITSAKTLFKTASTSTCCSMASTTVVAIACCTSGESTNGPTVFQIALTIIQGALPPVRNSSRGSEQHRNN